VTATMEDQARITPTARASSPSAAGVRARSHPVDSSEAARLAQAPPWTRPSTSAGSRSRTRPRTGPGLPRASAARPTASGVERLGDRRLEEDPGEAQDDRRRPVRRATRRLLYYSGGKYGHVAIAIGRRPTGSA
jgi:hypothetical protein